jgi:hypothetical protein
MDNFPVHSVHAQILKTLTNSKNCCGSRITTSVHASLSVIGRFSPGSTLHWMQEKSALLYNVHVLAGSHMIFQVAVSVFMLKMASDRGY